MSEVQTYLREHTLADMAKQYRLKIRRYEADDLAVLNYTCQRVHPIQRECRSLIIQMSTGAIVSRSFDAFDDLDILEETKEFIATEKLDGSLIKLYFWRDAWHVSTRSTAFAEMGGPYREHIANLVSPGTYARLDPRCTYIFELTSPENRVIIEYDRAELHLLAIRENTAEGRYREIDSWSDVFAIVPSVAQSDLDNLLAILRERNARQLTLEGFVLSDAETRAPRWKLKSNNYFTKHQCKPKKMIDKVQARLGKLVINSIEEFREQIIHDSPESGSMIEALCHSVDEQLKSLRCGRSEAELKKFVATTVDDKLTRALMFLTLKYSRPTALECYVVRARPDERSRLAQLWPSKWQDKM